MEEKISFFHILKNINVLSFKIESLSSFPPSHKRIEKRRNIPYEGVPARGPASLLERASGSDSL